MFHLRRHRPSVNRRARDRRSLRPRLTALEDRRLMATFVVSSVTDDGPGSLRDEIGLADKDTTNDTIAFSSALFGSIPRIIALSDGDLDYLTVAKPSGSLTIDGPGRACSRSTAITTRRSSSSIAAT